MKFDERRAPMKIVIGLLAAAILGTGGFAFAAGVDDAQPARTVSVPGTTTAVTTAATTTDDIVIGNAPAATTPTNGEDISGPCDEAEHANDPRCTGAGTTADDGDDDNSGPGSGGDDDSDDNSGHGSGHDSNDDSSGHGSGHDDNDD
jgi:hypothetical protein